MDDKDKDNIGQEIATVLLALILIIVFIALVGKRIFMLINW